MVYVGFICHLYNVVGTAENAVTVLSHFLGCTHKYLFLSNILMDDKRLPYTLLISSSDTTYRRNFTFRECS